jgi:hypothetical protein
MATISQETKDFLAYYTKHIDEILAIPSGTHAPNPEKLSAWVNAQASERRRIAAQALADNIIYITHADLIRYCEALMDMLYTDSETPIPKEHTLKWVVGGSPQKSSYFISAICYHFAKQKGYRLPDVILGKNFSYSDCPNSTIFYLDDMSYSGSQVHQLLFSIWTKTIREEVYKTKPEMRERYVNVDDVEPKHFDIRVGLCAATTTALEYLSKFKVTLGSLFKHRIYSERKQEEFDNPYKIYTVNTIPSLQTILSPQLYTDCNIFFNSYTDAPCICYFDHKLADPVSTFCHVIWFGPVPPTKINYEAIYKDGRRYYSPFKEYYTQQEEECDKEIKHTEFMPFLNNCPPLKASILEVFQRMPYNKFMDYHDWNSENDNPYTYNAKNENAYKYKNSPSERCPHSWYKNAKFQEGGRMRTRRKKLVRKN